MELDTLFIYNNRIIGLGYPLSRSHSWLFGTRFMGLHWVSPKNLSSYIYISRPNYIFLLIFLKFSLHITIL